MITTADCEFDKATGRLTLPSFALESHRFPAKLDIKSEHTGRVLTFVPIKEGHPLFNEDGWDGEMAIYEPTEAANVKTLTIYHYE